MRILTLCLAVGIVLAACGDDDTSEAGDAPAPATETADPEAATAAPEPSATPTGDESRTGGTDTDAAEVNEEEEEEEEEELFPDVLAAEATRSDDGTWRFSVTLSSPYDTPERYADAWRVLGPDGTELGIRILAHDHANEQPFTRSLGGVEIPEGVDTVVIEGRDQVSGWGGDTVELVLEP